MLNDTGIKTIKYGNTQQILFAVEHQVSMGAVISKSVGVLDVKSGKTIAKAGTPLAGSLDDRTTPFTKATGNDAVGVLLHDVDVTATDNNGTVLIFGFVNTNRIDETTRAAINQNVKNALPMIKFVAC